MKAEYAAAYELQMEWLRWSTTPDAAAMWNRAEKVGIKAINRLGKSPPGSMNAASRFYTGPLLHGDLYYVSSKVEDWLTRGYKKGMLPDDPFSLSWLPSQYGFVVLNKPLNLAAGVPEKEMLKLGPHFGLPATSNVSVAMQRDMDQITADAFGWSRDATGGIVVAFYGRAFTITVEESKIQTMIDASGQREVLRAAALADGNEPVLLNLDARDISTIKHGAGFYPISWFDVGTGMTWREEADEYRRVTALAEPDEGKRENADIEIAFAYAFLMFVNDRRIVVRRHRPDRAARKRAAALRERPTEEVSVIMLRAEEDAEFSGQDPNSVPMPRNWTCRWKVREHLRRNPRTGERSVRVSEYEKGPQHLPLRKGQRIYAVER